jgi:hypothetical protein
MKKANLKKRCPIKPLLVLSLVATLNRDGLNGMSYKRIYTG